MVRLEDPRNASLWNTLKKWQDSHHYQLPLPVVPIQQNAKEWNYPGTREAVLLTDHPLVDAMGHAEIVSERYDDDNVFFTLIHSNRISIVVAKDEIDIHQQGWVLWNPTAGVLNAVIARNKTFSQGQKAGYPMVVVGGRKRARSDSLESRLQNQVRGNDRKRGRKIKNHIVEIHVNQSNWGKSSFLEEDDWGIEFSFGRQVKRPRSPSDIQSAEDDDDQSPRAADRRRILGPRKRTVGTQERGEDHEIRQKHVRKNTWFHIESVFGAKPLCLANCSTVDDMFSTVKEICYFECIHLDAVTEVRVSSKWFRAPISVVQRQCQTWERLLETIQNLECWRVENYELNLCVKILRKEIIVID
ncbi:MAG: hypothetical protein M1833_003147 [Piccolia ochrophora]|nr:MAG: hypothetical protein M1833_003147 [Piccolia ochrophora]